MRENKPVTQREVELPDGATLMSTTDPSSRIFYANNTFIAVSGYSHDELIGQPHNLVRHPDMPPAAFADMWDTLKHDMSWTGVVKNRAKNGDHYWVHANVTPTYRKGKLTGYVSVRTKPERAQVQAADALYRAMREGRARNIKFTHGVAVRTGIASVLSLGKTASMGWRMAAALACPAVAALLALLACSLASVSAVWIVLAAIVGSACGMLFLDRQVSRPIRVILKQAQRVASGRTDPQRPFERIDEIGMLLRVVNQTGLNLRALIDDVESQSEGIETASAEIAAGNLDLSQRTEETAANLESTAGAMNQLASTIKTSADALRSADELSSHAADSATNGGDRVALAVKKMDEVRASSGRIGDIISTIDSIAFQTNILALNAAVEAARAGEQGRGFAVVAAEVRGLAQRSAQAAKEIKSLIDNSVATVNAGAQEVQAAGDQMQSIVEQVLQVSSLIGEIAYSTTEQSAGVEKMSASISSLDHATQQNAALVEQNAAASGNLGEMAKRLAEAIRVYR